MESSKVHFIDGNWQEGKGKPFSSYDPATGQELWTGAEASADDVKKAVKAANKAFPKWAILSFDKRLSYLEEFRGLLQENRNELVKSISEEMGKPLWEANGEVGAMINKLAVSVRAYQERSGESQSEVNDEFSIVRHKPHGVVAVLGPFNYPAHLPTGHIIPALLAGNTIIFKPSEYTPLVAESLIRLWQQADIPPGVINLVQGGRETGGFLAAEKINGLFFTGSYATGRLLHQQFSGQPELSFPGTSALPGGLPPDRRG